MRFHVERRMSPPGWTLGPARRSRPPAGSKESPACEAASARCSVPVAGLLDDEVAFTGRRPAPRSEDRAVNLLAADATKHASRRACTRNVHGSPLGLFAWSVRAPHLTGLNRQTCCSLSSRISRRARTSLGGRGTPR